MRTTQLCVAFAIKLARHLETKGACEPGCSRRRLGTTMRVHHHLFMDCQRRHPAPCFQAPSTVTVAAMEWAVDGRSAASIAALRREIAAYLGRHAEPGSDLSGAEQGAAAGTALIEAARRARCPDRQSRDACFAQALRALPARNVGRSELVQSEPVGARAETPPSMAKEHTSHRADAPSGKRCPTRPRSCHFACGQSGCWRR